ncbi:hypothetical protein PGT21_050170 [Puccinia graminis f. sp. tritici]|uniref:DDE Tnp4 domain-containing protein n=2 Tax=Puccinia graminis f. sp. tritici TaxID=56615 RepID=E3JQS9_PUCGT|nr:uncharacterized protein PGTG_00107 [Puccinia graminis f. sp. tritici CRL 75-36-700-3]EFP74151.1 hypothetical protein PGTG_00107 [Puccinia graminis f. sp. tritici CRL 75-36-700-3]KAA1115418.1 hypothetical protein PGT21_050170 [Puccinia graminis f. sp. tritici]
MVRYSQRKACLTAVRTAIELKVTTSALEFAFGLDNDSSSDEDEDNSSDDEDFDSLELEDLLHLLKAVTSVRYFAPRTTLQQAPPIHDFLLVRLEDRRFKQEFRMSRDSFIMLCKRVADDPVFHNNSNNPQRPIEEQMMVTLKRLGCFGNGSSVGMLARFFRVGEGTVELYTNRCIMAILRIQSQLLKWPSAEERVARAIEYGEDGFDGCIGVIDGSLIPLSDCPSRHGSDYYSRKGFYCISTLIVCDSQRNIQYMYTGWPGCSHDSRVMGNSPITLNPDKYFKSGEFLLADSAYTTTMNVVAAFKKPSHGSLTEDEHSFNYYLAQKRVVIEQCIGGLKGQFQSLKGLRLRIGGKRDRVRANAWIIACGVLHNFLNQGDEYDFDDVDPGLTDAPAPQQMEVEPPTQRSTAAARAFREKIKKAVLELHE